MRDNKKILINSIVMYVKIITNTIFTLIATRVALKGLGAESYGLYNLLVGVVSLISFLNMALIISTQRFYSIAIGSGNKDELRSLFNVSLYIHFMFGMILVVGLLAAKPFLFNGFLSIPPGMETASITMYHLMIVSSFVTIFIIPYSAMITAQQDIYLLGLTEMLSGGLRCLSAVAILYLTSYKLELFTLFTILSFVLVAFLKYLWCRFRYSEVRIKISLMRNKELINKMLGFTGWNTLGSGAVVVRNQGIAVVLNVFNGVVVNAAYGIANQVSGLVDTMSATITTVFTPAIIQAHGEGDDAKMMRMATLSSKVSFLISNLIAIPVLAFTPQLLELWLGKYPEYTIGFCQFIIVTFLIKQLMPGFNRVIYAMGNIKWFQITLACCLIGIVPAGFIVGSLGLSIYWVFIVMCVSQVFALITEIYYLNKYISINLIELLVKSVFLPVLLFSAFMGGIMFCVSVMNDISLSMVLVLSGVFCSIYLVIYFYLVLTKQEQSSIKNMIRR